MKPMLLRWLVTGTNEQHDDFAARWPLFEVIEYIGDTMLITLQSSHQEQAGQAAREAGLKVEDFIPFRRGGGDRVTS